MEPRPSLHPDFGPSYGEQPVPYGIPVTIVNGGPRVRVTFEYADESDRVRYPLSRATRIEGGWNAGGDRHAIVVDARTCRLYETWNTRLQGGRWTAGSGAVWDLRSNRLRPEGWTSADAAGLPILPGLLRYDEVKAGHVDHAIRFTTPITQRAYLWPARHQAGATDDPGYPPMGARFRLNADYDVSSYSPQARVVLRAMAEYGLVLADNGSAWYFQGTADRALARRAHRGAQADPCLGLRGGRHDQPASLTVRAGTSTTASRRRAAAGGSGSGAQRRRPRRRPRPAAWSIRSGCRLRRTLPARMWSSCGR